MIATYGELCENDRATLEDLTRKLGLEPKNISVNFAVESLGSRCFLLLTEYLRDDAGCLMILAEGYPASRPHLFELGPESLPGPLRPVES